MTAADAAITTSQASSPPTSEVGRGAQTWIALATTAAVAVWAVAAVEPPMALLGFGLLAVIWGTASAIDLKDHQLPDVLTLSAYPAFLLLQLPAAAVTGDWGSLGRAALGGIVTGVVLFVIAFVNPAGFGLGDVKLGLSTGAALGWLGWMPMVFGLLGGFILMTLISGVLVATKRLDRRGEIAFGPFMVLGVLVAPWLAMPLGHSPS